MIKKLSFLIVAIALVVCVLSPLPKGTLASNQKFFTIIHTNDEHSALLPSPLSEYHPDYPNRAIGGFPRLAQLVTDIRAKKASQGEPVLLINAGDFLGGSPFAWLALDGKAAELSLMIKLGYDIVAIGNHEFDFGPEILAQYLRSAGYPEANANTVLLATNTLPPAGHPLLEVGLKKTHIKTLNNGLKVGFFSVIGVDAVDVAPLAKPVEFGEQIAAAKEAVAELKKQGAEVIIAVTHAGIDEDRTLAKNVPGIHVIVGGHCHTEIHEPIIEGSTIIVQSGELLEHAGILELAYDPATAKVQVRNKQTGQKHLVPLDDKIGAHPEFVEETNRLVEELNSFITRLTDGRFSDIRKAIVRSDFVVSDKPELKETPFANFITDAMRIIGEQATGEKVHFAIQANGVIRGSIKPATSPHAKGNVAFMDLIDLVGLGSGPDKQPGYPLVSVYVTGEEMRRILEVGALLAELKGNTYFLQYSGLRQTYDPARAVIARIPVKGTPIPSTRAVLKAERFTGTGVQGSTGYVPIKRGDQELYHLISDYYIAQFLPMAGKLLPSLGIVLKDKNGKPIADIKDAIVYRNGHELKVWQTVVEYAASLPKNAEGVPVMPEYYSKTSGRIVEKRTVPLLLYPSVILVALISLLVMFIRRRRRCRGLNRLKPQTEA